MGKTISEKILSQASKCDAYANDIVWVDVDKAMTHDILGPRLVIADALKAKKKEVWNKSGIVVVSDHYPPAANANQANLVKFNRDWASEYDIKNYYECMGTCHQIMVEEGHALPGTIVVGTDSHTITYGALNCFATGIGSTEMYGVFLDGKIWFKVPETIKIIWNGKLHEGVMGKDISLKTIGTLGHDGATYMSMEYTGNAITELSMDGRLAISNMAVEAGAKVGLMDCDEKCKLYLESIGISRSSYHDFKSDPDAVFNKVIELDADKLVPQIACPHEVDNVCDINDAAGTKIDQCYIGSCTGGRYEDIKIAAKILKGKKIHRSTRLLISPSSKKIYAMCLKDGFFDILDAAGAIILPSTCGICAGLHSGVMADGEVCLSSSNRNFIGRMGNIKSFTYLASPATIAASSINGYITDPRIFLD